MANNGVPDLVITGRTRFWEIDVPDPLFQYVRWCSDFQIVDRVTQRVVGVVSRSGRRGTRHSEGGLGTGVENDATRYTS